MRKRYTLRQRLIMALRDVRDMAQCRVSCPGGCSGPVTGGPDGPWVCGKCSGMWQ